MGAGADFSCARAAGPQLWRIPMGQHFLYSTNVLLKQLLQQRYASDIHYVWCSEDFDSQAQGAYTQSSLVVPSSNPADLYKQLADDVARGDTHSAKINAQRTSFTSLAKQWAKVGKITPSQRDDMLFIVKTAPLAHWRPLVYVIPRAFVQARLRQVPASKCAGLGMEYIRLYSR